MSRSILASELSLMLITWPCHRRWPSRSKFFHGNFRLLAGAQIFQNPPPALWIPVMSLFTWMPKAGCQFTPASGWRSSSLSTSCATFRFDKAFRKTLFNRFSRNLYPYTYIEVLFNKRNKKQRFWFFYFTARTSRMSCCSRSLHLDL